MGEAPPIPPWSDGATQDGWDDPRAQKISIDGLINAVMDGVMESLLQRPQHTVSPSCPWPGAPGTVRLILTDLGGCPSVNVLP